MKIIGIDIDGKVICKVLTQLAEHDLPVGTRFNSGRTPEEFGLENMTPEERLAVGRP